MLIGAHVSTTGGLVEAHARGIERGCEAIQVFNQSPRAWRPTEWKPDDIAAFRALMADGPIRSVVIHAVYLINCASPDRVIRTKSLAALVHSLRAGAAIGADGVVVHPGSAVGEPHSEALDRVAAGISEALAESEGCPILLENTAGAGQTLGRTFGELAQLIDRLGGDARVGACLDCCHLLASGYDVRTIEGVSTAVDAFEGALGLERLRCLHVNDSQVPLGSNRDRHAAIGSGELGRKGIAAFVSEPRFDGLPALLETPGPEGKGPDADEVALTLALRGEGLAARDGGGATARRGGRTPSRSPAARAAPRRKRG